MTPQEFVAFNQDEFAKRINAIERSSEKMILDCVRGFAKADLSAASPDQIAQIQNAMESLQKLRDAAKHTHSKLNDAAKTLGGGVDKD